MPSTKRGYERGSRSSCEYQDRDAGKDNIRALALERTERDDSRGARYVIEGAAADKQTAVGVVGRFTSTGRYLIITVYAMTESEE